MTVPIEIILFCVAALIFLSVVASRLADKFALPALLIFLGIGMLAGSEGPGGIFFDDPSLAKTIGIVALIFIIFSGGINTSWPEIRPVLGPGIALSTAGVLITAVVVGFFAVFALKFSFLEGLLLGSIISSTDAAAVFSVLKSRKIGLKSPLKPLLEFESGSNDPMAVFLTIGFIQILTSKSASLAGLIPSLIRDMGLGALVGYLMARISIFVVNRLKLETVDLYPVLTIALVLLTYTVAVFLKGNGFLAVFIVGLFMSKNYLVHKKTIVRFHESLAWIMQIVMFLSLGLLVFPSQLVAVTGVGLFLAVVLMFLARPISVFLCLLPFRLDIREKAMISWVGLRGAVPIILAAFPLLAGVPQAHTIFNVIFFVVLTSVLIQGTSISFVSKLLGVDVPLNLKKQYPLAIDDASGVDAELTDILVPYESDVSGKPIYEIGVPGGCLIVLISRGDKFVIPGGSTVIEGGDVIQVLANREDLAVLQAKIGKLQKE